MALDKDWGAPRIHGELAKLGFMPLIHRKNSDSPGPFLDFGFPSLHFFDFGSLYGKFNDDSGPAFFFGLRIYFALMFRHDSVTDGKAETRSFSYILRGEKGFENFVEVLVGDSCFDDVTMTSGIPMEIDFESNPHGLR